MTSPTEVASSAEVSAGALAQAKLARLLHFFERHGYAVLGNAVPAQALAVLAPRMDADAARLAAGGGQDRGAFGNGHLQLGPPRSAPWVRAEFVANPLIEQVAAAILGPSPFLSFYNGNCNSPGSGSQKLHRDSSPWGSAGEIESQRATTINVNFSTRAIDRANGAVEIWPGSHRDPGEPALCASRRQEVPPIQLEAPVGAVAFRDHRMWHRGVANGSDFMRQMVSLNYNAAAMLEANEVSAVARRHGHDEDDDSDRRLVFGADCRAAFAAPSRFGVNRNVRFFHGPVDYFSGIFGPGGAAEGSVDHARLAKM
jgi:ectoine hydroxylase-related dioxygenase (phytanoyl-CoA dioxygenase family)